jgi:hypothetical protein
MSRPKHSTLLALTMLSALSLHCGEDGATDPGGLTPGGGVGMGGAAAGGPGGAGGGGATSTGGTQGGTQPATPGGQSTTAGGAATGGPGGGGSVVDGGASPGGNAGGGGSDAGPATNDGGGGGSSDAGKDAAVTSDAGSPGASDASTSTDASPTPDAGGGGGNDTTIPMTIPKPSNGSGEIRTSTTVLKSGSNGGKDVWDFNNQRIGVNNTEDCEDGEGQKTVFEVEDGVTVKNLIIAGGINAGNGIVCKGSCTLDHVYWEDVCEDAATNSKDGATMRLTHVIALHASDKVFQHNAKGGSKTILENSYVSDFGKLWRSCGDCTANGGPRHLVLNNVRVEGVKTAVAGPNQNYGDTVTITKLFVKGGYDASSDKPKICQEFIGVTDHQGESTKVNDGASQWSTRTCVVKKSDVSSW